MKKIFALVDCNNFYASCERVFRPYLNGKPVVILSNNDGCVIARSNEAKKYGIPMGAPYYQYEHLIRAYRMHVFSSNYVLYGDMSRRIMQALDHFTPDLEVYSIDEAFLALDGITTPLHYYGLKIKRLLYQWTGLPVSIGIAPTKTLAKIANHVAKKSGVGVLNLMDYSKADINNMLAMVSVDAVWGVGRKYTEWLHSQSIYTALDLQRASRKRIQKKMTVCGLRTVLELNGKPCIDLETAPAPKKSILSSRSFGRNVTAKKDLHEAIATYASKAALKLRDQKLMTGCLTVFIRTNRFQQKPQYHNYAVLQLDPRTYFSHVIVRKAKQLIDRIYKPGYIYHKAGILLSDLAPAGSYQAPLLEDASNGDFSKKNALSRTVDAINERYDSRKIFLGATGIKKSWGMKQERRSEKMTTNWFELPIVKAF